MEDIERTLLVKPEVFVYKIGPRPSARGYRAADWNLAAPDWTGRLRCLVKGKGRGISLSHLLGKWENVHVTTGLIFPTIINNWLSRRVLSLVFGLRCHRK